MWQFDVSSSCLGWQGGPPLHYDRCLCGNMGYRAATQQLTLPAPPNAVDTGSNEGASGLRLNHFSRTTVLPECAVFYSLYLLLVAASVGVAVS